MQHLLSCTARQWRFKPSDDAFQRTFHAAVTLRTVFWFLCSCPKPLNDWRNSVPQAPPCRSQWRAFGLYAE
jgi:hypothetical protein